MAEVKSDIQIARAAKKKPIQEVGGRIGIPNEHLLPYGHDKAKVSAEFIKSVQGNKDGKLILVTAINPTPAGEGKTTTTVGLGDGLNRIGKKAVICIREASLGPNFGMKGSAAGGGMAQVVPMDDMNLHFTGDFHAITSAHNLLSALIDNHIYWGNDLGIDMRRVTWRRVMDMNDRALRQIVCSLGGVANGYPREAGFDITLRPVEFASLQSSLARGDFEVGQSGWSGRVDPDGNIHTFVTCKGALNDGHYCNPEVDKLLNEARTVPDETKRRAIYDQAQTIIQDELPGIYNYYQPWPFALAKKVKGFVPYPDGMIRLKGVTFAQK